MRASSRSRRRGFILPTTLLIITLVTVMLAAAFVMVSAEYRVTDNAFASARSLAIAQAGMQNYFAVGHILTGTSDSARYTFSGGYARVQAYRLRDSTTTSPKRTAVWVVRSIGYDTVRASSGQPNAQRGIAHIAQLQPGTLPARAGFVAVNGIGMIGAGAHPISGRDPRFTAVPGCVRPADPDTNGLSLPAGSFSSGDTVGVREGVEVLGSVAATLDSVQIDWAALLGGQFTPDFVNQFPPAGNSTYQTHYFPGDVTIPAGTRRGLLVVRGDVTLTGGPTSATSTHWDGIIVAGGQLDAGAAGQWVVHGMIITGLNKSIGEGVSANRIRRGATSSSGHTLMWDWCYARASIGALSYLIPIKNAWVDNWSIY